MSSALVEEPPGAQKLALIRRYLIASKIQAKIDSGSFLRRLAMPGSPLWAAAAGGSGEPTFFKMGEDAFKALVTAYEKRRPTWQGEYERHVNCEFDEEELLMIVKFLESAAGEHLLEGQWLIEAYTSTNTEDLVEEIYAEAIAALGGAAQE